MSISCSNCGKELPDDAKFCLQCGTSITASKEEKREEMEDKTNKPANSNPSVVPYVIPAIVCVAFIIIGLFIGQLGIFFIGIGIFFLVCIVIAALFGTEPQGVEKKEPEAVEQKLHNQDEELFSPQQDVQNNPHSYEAWTELGHRQHELGQENDALASANKALEILSTKKDLANEDSNKAYARAWMVRGAALSTMEGKEVDALAACEEALGYEPNNLEALYYKGMVFSIQEHDSLALRTYNRILQLDPTHKAAMLGKGLLYLVKDNFDEALIVASEVVEKNPDDAAAWRLQGMAYNYKGERVGSEGELEEGYKLLDMAIASFNKAIEIDPLDPNTYLLKAGPYLATGDYGKALDTLNQGLKMVPNDKPLQEAKAKVIGMRTNETTRKVAGTAGKIALRGGVELAKGSVDIAKLFFDVLRKS